MHSRNARARGPREPGQPDNRYCQGGSPLPGSRRRAADDAEPWAGLLSSLFATQTPLLAAVLRIYFRRIRVRGPLPVRGSALVVANHPCTWVDAGVLDHVLRRRLHFLTDDYLFHPPARALLLRIYGALPLSIHPDDTEHARRNAATYRRCEELFDRGDAVAVFPEGVSLVDRGLLRLHSGAARLALGYHSRADAPPLALVPVSLHYADRSAFRSDVTVTVGAPIALGDSTLAPGLSLDEAAARLTSRMALALRAGLADFDRCGGAAAVALEQFATRDGGPPTLEVTQELAAALSSLALSSPARHLSLLRRSRAYARACRALGVTDRAFATDERGAGLVWGAGRVAVEALALGPALAGAALHAVPLALVERSTRRHTRDASQLTLVRLTAAMVWLSLWYLVIALGAAFLSGSVVWAAGVIALGAVTGALAWRVAAAGRGWAERMRVEWIGRGHPRLVARARALRSALSDEVLALIARARA